LVLFVTYNNRIYCLHYQHISRSGSKLTLPALMMMVMPADIANATSRVGVLLQSVLGIAVFKKYNELVSRDLPAILSLSILGGVFGAFGALAALVM
jgi:uncharacterized membrane protein YfcA